MRFRINLLADNTHNFNILANEVKIWLMIKANLLESWCGFLLHYALLKEKKLL